MRISAQRLQQIINEEYARAQRAQRLQESTQDYVQVTPQLLHQIIMEETNKFNAAKLHESRSVQVTPHMLRQMILEESFKARRFR